MSKQHWYNNGVVSKRFDENMQPNGWILGRLSGCGLSTLGKHWYNNGFKEGNFRDGEQPKGWVKGTLHVTKGYRTYNNGTINKVFKRDEVIPEGWVRGRLASTNDGLKRVALYKKNFYYNNGVNTIKVHYGDKVPDGYVYEGRLPNERKTSRDAYYLQKGYIPLKDLVKIYGKSWYVYMENLDKIVFKDPYVYINKNEISRIEEYVAINHSKGTSILEQEVVKFIQSIYDGEIRTNVRDSLKDENAYYEMDIYIPELNVGIEVNGIYWHSTINKNKDYHVTKTNIATHLGIRLIQIYEDRWELKQDICKSIIRSALGRNDRIIYARKCTIRDVIRDDERVFLNNNHIQGYVASSRCIGLYYKDELVQLVSFRKSRFKAGEYELVRHCSVLNTSVVGGFSKLMKHANMDCISYVDRSLFTGAAYFKAGFTYLNTTPPSYVYFKKGSFERLNRIAYQKYKLSKILSEFDETKTEVENMLTNGYLQVYDCGTIKLQYLKND